MKKYCAYILLLIILFLPKVNAQDEIDYEDDINPYVIGDSIDLIIPQLVDFLEKNANHPASNLQLARVFEQRWQESDYLIDFDAAIQNAEYAKLLYNRSGNLVDDREVRRNEWYYPNYTDEFKKNGKPILTFEKIQQEIKRGLIESDSFLTYMPAIQENFMKMVANYDLATKTFVRINGDFNSLKDIYLLYDQNLDARFNLLKDSYDSTLYYYEAYKQAASKYPPFEVTQKLNLKAINTYRLDGLVIQTDFFRPEVDLWQYAEWVNGLRVKVENEIKVLRVDIDKIEETLSKSLKDLDKASIGDSVSLNPISSKEIFKIRKYDLNSPVANLFQYKDDKLDLVFEKKSLQKFDTLTAVSPQLKLYTFNNLFQKILRSQADIKVYQKELDRSNLQKNIAFYAKYYNGAEGVEKYFNQESDWMLDMMKQIADSIKQQIGAHYTNVYHEEQIVYKRKSIAFLSPLSNVDTFSTEVNRVTLIRNNVNELSYMAGYFFNADSVRQSFFAAKKGGEILWYENQPTLTKGATEWQQIGGVSLASGGDATFSLYRRNTDSLNFRNSLIKINQLGKVVNEIEVDTENQPVFLSDLRNKEEHLAIYQGDGFDQAAWPTEVSIVKFHPDSSNYLIRELDINGAFVGFFQLDDASIFVSKSRDGQSINFTKVSEAFEVLKKQSFQFTENQYLRFIYKISDQSLHLVAAKVAGHIVVNDRLELIYSEAELK